MAGWLKNVFNDICKKTEGMDKEQKIEYIAAYYWYHILFFLIGIVVVIMLIRHLFFGPPPKMFTCVLVNQAIDFERDAVLTEDFALFSGIMEKQISIDSNYVFSYVGKQLEGTNESSYDKFFFRLGNGELDAAVIPESFYKYCMELEYKFADLEQILTREQLCGWQEQLLYEKGVCNGIYVKDMLLMEYLDQEKDDPVVLVFFLNEDHEEADRAFFCFATSI